MRIKFVFLLMGFLCLSSVFSAEDSKVSDEKDIHLGIGFSIPVYFSHFSVEDDLFDGGHHSPALAVSVNSMYEIPQKSLALIARFEYGWLGADSKDFWGEKSLTGMKGNEWAFSFGAGYKLKPSEKLLLVSGASVALRKTDLRGAYKASQDDVTIVKNDYSYSCWDFELGPDLYCLVKIKKNLGLGIDFNPSFKILSNGNVSIDDNLTGKTSEIKCSSALGSMNLSTHISLVYSF